MFVKVYLSKAEKDKLTEIAKRKNMPISKLCYEQLAPLIHQGYLNPSENNKQEPALATRVIKVYLTDSDYQTLLHRANGTALSVYIRLLILDNHEPIVIEISTDDILELSATISAYLTKFYNTIGELKYRDHLYEQDIQKLLSLAENTQSAIEAVAKTSIANRKSIRNSGVRYLKKKLNALLQSNFGVKEHEDKMERS